MKLILSNSLYLCVFLAFSTTALAGYPEDRKDLRLNKSQFTQLYMELKVELAAPRISIKKSNYVQSFTKILAKKGLWKNGVQHCGVFLVSTPDGSMVLKTSIHAVATQKKSLTIQDHLAKYDIAPRVRGLIEADELKKLLPTILKVFPDYDKKILSRCRSGILMDEIHGHFVKQDGPPDYTKFDWDESGILKQFDDIQHFLNCNRITHSDPQGAITDKGQFILSDFDSFRLQVQSNFDAGQELVCLNYTIFASYLRKYLKTVN